jgi:hypothetical protein
MRCLGALILLLLAVALVCQADGEKPFATYGVDADEGLFKTAREYFGIRVHPRPAAGLASHPANSPVAPEANSPPAPIPRVQAGSSRSALAGRPLRGDRACRCEIADDQDQLVIVSL